METQTEKKLIYAATRVRKELKRQIESELEHLVGSGFQTKSPRVWRLIDGNEGEAMI